MSKTKIGALKYYVKLRKQTDIPAMGGTINPTFEDVADVWADHEPVGNAIFYGTKQVGEDVTDRFVIRRNSAINERTLTSSHVIEHEGQRYRIKRASDLRGEHRFVMLETEGLGNA